MTNQTLHERLEKLGHAISETRARMKREAHLFSGGMHLTADELKDRYRILQARLEAEVADAEAHGHHVSDLEKSVRQWLDSVDEAHRASPSQKDTRK
ncbi:MAG: 3-ketoacyl-ACP reductase [Rhodobacteraceae bacterium]|nr:3-ketoacyl-ACP reductase [Paracoccaceae bacterium]